MSLTPLFSNHNTLKINQLQMPLQFPPCSRYTQNQRKSLENANIHRNGAIMNPKVRKANERNCTVQSLKFENGLLDFNIDIKLDVCFLSVLSKSRSCYEGNCS